MKENALNKSVFLYLLLCFWYNKYVGDVMEKPLALKLSPNSIDEVIGQKHLLGKGKVLRNLVENKQLS